VYRVRAFGNLAEALRVIEKRRYGKAHLVCNKQTLVFPVFPPYKKPKKRCPLLYSCVSPITKRNDVSCVLDRVVIDGFSYEPITIVFPLNAVSADDPRPRNAWCSVILTEGKNREIRKIFNALNLHVSRLIRISYGDFSLHEITPTLNAGDFREFHFTEKRGALL
jgi:hypothetical protein